MCITAKRKKNIELQEYPIYPFIRDYLPFVPVVHYQKGEYLFRGEDKEKNIYYVLDGLVEIENLSYNGKKLVMENARKNSFIGFISDIHKVNLQASGLALTPVEALVFSETVMDKLMNNDKFSIFFYQETCSRVFRLCKALLIKVLFSPDEIMAYYILNNAKSEIFSYKNSYSLCENVGISRRGVYNILYRFEELSFIRKLDHSMYKITDRPKLTKRAEHIIHFVTGNAEMQSDYEKQFTE